MGWPTLMEKKIIVSLFLPPPPPPLSFSPFIILYYIIQPIPLRAQMNKYMYLGKCNFVERMCFIPGASITESDAGGFKPTPTG